MSWLVAHIHRIMILSGVLTMTMFYAALAPEAALLCSVNRIPAPPASSSPTKSVLLRAQGRHRIQPQGAVRGHQAGDQRNENQRGSHGGERRRI